MKTSVFLSKVLKSFHNGKSYSANGIVASTTEKYPCESKACSICYSFSGKPNLIAALVKFEDKLGVKMKNKSLVSIAKSLGHTNIEGFQKVGFSKVKEVVKATIKRERANGN